MDSDRGNAPPDTGLTVRVLHRCPAGRPVGASVHGDMPTDLQEASTGGASLVFADDAAGCRFRLREASLYEPEEVQEELGHDGDGPPEYGRWLPVEIEDEEAWMVAPGELIEELQRLEAGAGEIFEVARIEKSGSGETDPFEVNLERLSDDDQTRF